MSEDKIIEDSKEDNSGMMTMDDIKNANKSRGLGWFEGSSSDSEKSFKEIEVAEDLDEEEHKSIIQEEVQQEDEQEF